jgi:hypothetical protein
MSIISEESKKDKAERNVQMILDDDEEDFRATLWEQLKLDHPAHDNVELVESQQKFEEAQPELLKKFAEDVHEQWEEQTLEDYAHDLYRAVKHTPRQPSALPN